MLRVFGNIITAIGLVACSQIVEISLPAIDTSELAAADALIVLSQSTSDFASPASVTRGFEEGAEAAMKGYIDDGSRGALLPSLLLAPIALPTAAAIGASKAHSAMEVDAALAAFQRVSEDNALLTSISDRFVAELSRVSDKKWKCVTTITPAQDDGCTRSDSYVAIILVPNFSLTHRGSFDPEISLLGSVALIALAPDGTLQLRAEWRYFGRLGTLFALAENDASLLREKIKAVLDEFAVSMVEDMFLKPRPEPLRFRRGPSYLNVIPPKEVVWRAAPVAQKSVAPSPAL